MRGFCRICSWAQAGYLVLALQSAACAQIILRDDFEDGDFAPGGHLFYKHNAEQDAGTFRFQSQTVRSGKAALELTVKPKCLPGDEDCSERAEVWEKPDAHVPYQQGAWYAFSVKFAEPAPQDQHRYVIAQWKREIVGDGKSDVSPLLAIRLTNGKLYATAETAAVPGVPRMVCEPGESRIFAEEGRNQTRALIAAESRWGSADGDIFNSCTRAIQVAQRGGQLPSPGSGWIDFVIFSKPGPSGDGRIEIIANNQWVSTVTGQIGHQGPGLGPSQYFKFGPYRAGHSGEWTLYFDNFRRGPACRDVTDGFCPP